eukprot:11161945-Lingulodinium_polyedra.AAC.1
MVNPDLEEFATQQLQKEWAVVKERRELKEERVLACGRGRKGGGGRGGRGDGKGPAPAGGGGVPQ